MSLILRIVIALLTVPLLSACFSTYNLKTKSAHDAFHRGDYEQALTLINRVKAAPRDQLLYLLDKGMILHGIGRYAESNAILTEAENLADQFSTKSISREVGATLWSEEATAYAGEKFEVVMIGVIRMLNYIMLDDWEGALVEVRHIQYLGEKKYGSVKAYDNAFSLYLSAMVWETLGYINDALIDYRRLASDQEKLPYYGYDIKDTSQKIHLPSQLPPKDSLAWEASSGYRKERGQLILLVESGRSPEFVAETVSTGLFSISLPQVMAFPHASQSASVMVDGKNAGQTYSFYNIADDIFVAAKERSKRSFVRKMIKLSAQTGLYIAGSELAEKDETESKVAGMALIFLGLTMSASEKADERSWRTLPALFQLGRFYLPPGTHDIKIIPMGGGTPLEKTVAIPRDKPAVLLVRFTEGAAVARRVGPELSPRITEVHEREKNLSQEISKKPHDGNLKLELANERMKTGNYHVEGLLEDGLKDGGDKQIGIQSLVIVKMVKGEYREARKWAQKGSGLKKMDFYADAASYLLGEKDMAPSTNKIRLAKDESLDNAFDQFVAALIDEKQANYEMAATEFADAYKYGLIGEPVSKKFMDNFKKTDDAFKKSDQGIEMVSRFADSYLPQVTQ